MEDWTSIDGGRRGHRVTQHFTSLPDGPLLRPSNEGLLRPGVARAQKIIRLHPFLFFSILLSDGRLQAHFRLQGCSGAAANPALF